MKTSLLIIIGIITTIAISITSISVIFNQEIKLATGMISDKTPEPTYIPDPICIVLDKATGSSGSAVTMDACYPLSDFESLGCDRMMLEHIYKYTNLLDEYFDGNYYGDAMGLPDGVSKEKFEWCVDFIYEKRFPSNDTKSEKLKLEAEPEPETTHTLNEVHCFTNQVIYNDECVYVLAPTDEFPKEMTKYFSVVDDVIVNFCEIKTATSQDRENVSGVSLDRCFEISSYIISDVNVIKFQSTTPPTWINIKLENLIRYVEIGSFPTFRVVESGWGSGCTSPTLEVYHMKQEVGNDHTTDELIYKHRIVYSCPYYEPRFPPPDVLRVWDESDFPNFPICEEQGRYLIVGDSGYERLPLDYYYCGVENEN